MNENLLCFLLVAGVCLLYLGVIIIALYVGMKLDGIIEMPSWI